MIDDLDSEIDACEKELRSLGADDPYASLLQSAPGIAWLLGLRSPRRSETSHASVSEEADGLHRALPRVYQSGGKDFRGPISKNGPKYLRWSLIEAAVHASSHPVYKDHYDRTKARLGRRRGAKIARIEVARKLAEAIWHMLQTDSIFLRQGPTPRLWSLGGPRLRWTSRSSPTRPFPPLRRR